jgi:hypothetical protein
MPAPGIGVCLTSMTVQAGSLAAVVIGSPGTQPRNLRLRAGLTELATLDEIADVVSES